MYCDQPSLPTRDPVGEVNKEIPHRWGKQPHRYFFTDQLRGFAAIERGKVYMGGSLEREGKRERHGGRRGREHITKGL